MKMNLHDARDVASRLEVLLDGVSCRLLRVDGQVYAQQVEVTALGDDHAAYLNGPTLLRLTVEVDVSLLPAGTQQDLAALAAPGQRAIKISDTKIGHSGHLVIAPDEVPR